MLGNARRSEDQYLGRVELPGNGMQLLGRVARYQEPPGNQHRVWGEGDFLAMEKLAALAIYKAILKILSLESAHLNVTE